MIQFAIFLESPTLSVSVSGVVQNVRVSDISTTQEKSKYEQAEDLASLGALMIGAVGISFGSHDPGDILGSETGSLTVHKFAKAPGEIEGARDGSAVDPGRFR